MKNKFVVIIPARINSTRIKKKMILSVGEYPLIIQTAIQSKKSSAQNVVVATDDEEIFNLCYQYNINAIMTDVNHKSGTDRVVEASIKLNLDDNDTIINVQGDEPLVNYNLINDLAEFFVEKKTNFATVAGLIENVEDVFNPNIVKVVLDKDDNALYFSRSPIPFYRDGYVDKLNSKMPRFNVLKHIGIYAYNLKYLKIFKNSPQSEIEQVESLEQLRALYNGEKIAVLKNNSFYHHGVDTYDDLERVQKILLEKNHEFN